MFLESYNNFKKRILKENENSFLGKSFNKKENLEKYKRLVDEKVQDVISQVQSVVEKNNWFIANNHPVGFEKDSIYFVVYSKDESDISYEEQTKFKESIIKICDNLSENNLVLRPRMHGRETNKSKFGDDRVGFAFSIWFSKNAKSNFSVFESKTKQGKYQISNPMYHSEKLDEERIQKLDKLAENFIEIDNEISKNYPELKITGKAYWGVTENDNGGFDYFMSDKITEEDLDNLIDKVGKEKFNNILDNIFANYHNKFIDAINNAGFKYIDAEENYYFTDKK